MWPPEGHVRGPRFRFVRGTLSGRNSVVGTSFWASILDSGLWRARTHIGLYLLGVNQPQAVLRRAYQKQRTR